VISLKKIPINYLLGVFQGKFSNQKINITKKRQDEWEILDGELFIRAEN